MMLWNLEILLELQRSWIAIYFKIHFRVLLRPICAGGHSLKSGPETQDTATLRHETLVLWGHDTQDSGTETLGHQTLLPRTPELGPWDLELAILRPRILRVVPWESNLWNRFLVSRPLPQIELTFVKQTLITKS